MISNSTGGGISLRIAQGPFGECGCMRLVFCKQIDSTNITQRINRTDFIRVENAQSATFDHGGSRHTNR